MSAIKSNMGAAANALKQANKTEIDEVSFQVKGNVMWFPDYFIQLSNVADVSLEKPAEDDVKIPPKFWICGFMFLFVGFMLIGSFLEFFGILMIAGAVVILAIFTIVALVGKGKPKEDRYIDIRSNSGSTFHLTCGNETYAKYVMDSLRYCIDNPVKGDAITIKCKDSKIAINSKDVNQSN